ncbi:MAG: hypothetical protein M0P73_13505 [Syntrophobacterales bacterium]|jgi:hypothetical protein|nr:hypothetical protein [Syntrophobacterales bacterium]
MRRLTFIGIAILALMAGLAQIGLAITISDVYTDDANTIVPNPTYGTGNTLTVYENYGETYLIPYPSHDGYAIVAADPTYNHNFFDKQVTPDSAGAVQITFVVTNTGPYTWSDYHFEIFGNAVINDASDDVFLNKSVDSAAAQFWAPNWVAPSDTVTFVLNLTSSDGGVFGVRQIATTTPIPGAVWLLGGGLAGLLGFRGFRRRQ